MMTPEERAARWMADNFELFALPSNQINSLVAEFRLHSYRTNSLAAEFRSIRNVALTEAATIADNARLEFNQGLGTFGKFIGSKIRALKEQQP